MNRDYTYLPAQRAAVGMHTEYVGDGRNKLTLALAFCNYRDQFNRRIARRILDGRIDHRLEGFDTRLTFVTFYEGDYPRNDVFYPVVDAMRERLGKGVLALHRGHIDIVGAVNAANLELDLQWMDLYIPADDYEPAETLRVMVNPA